MLPVEAGLSTTLVSGAKRRWPTCRNQDVDVFRCALGTVSRGGIEFQRADLGRFGQ